MKYVKEWLRMAAENVYDGRNAEMVRDFWPDSEAKGILLASLSGLSVHDGSGKWNIVRAVAEAELPEDDPDVKRLRKLREEKIRWVTSQNISIISIQCSEFVQVNESKYCVG